jgi:hypothetical protein
MRKPELVGKVFGAYIREQISYDEVARLSVAIDRAFLSDLLVLGDKPIVDTLQGQSEWHQRLALCGLMQQMVDYQAGLSSYTIGNPQDMTVTYCRNDLNQLFVAVCLLDERASTIWFEGRRYS